MKITKAHKLYFRTPKGELRRVDKVAPKVYSAILNGFINEDYKSRYNYLNRGVTHWSKYKPLPIVISKELTDDFLELLVKAKIEMTRVKSSIIISYNGSWHPLVIISLEEMNKKDLDLKGFTGLKTCGVEASTSKLKSCQDKK